MVTMAPAEVPEGLAKVTDAPLAVCAVPDPFSVPQLETLQLSDQSTPAMAGSLATIAVNAAE